MDWLQPHRLNKAAPHQQTTRWFTWGRVLPPSTAPGLVHLYGACCPTLLSRLLHFSSMSPSLPPACPSPPTAPAQFVPSVSASFYLLQVSHLLSLAVPAWQLFSLHLASRTCPPCCSHALPPSLSLSPRQRLPLPAATLPPLHISTDPSPPPLTVLVLVCQPRHRDVFEHEMFRGCHQMS